MLAYLKKFNELPVELREQVSAPAAMAALAAMEKEHKLSLATLVIRVMVKDISILDLAKYFVLENGMPMKQAEMLVERLKNEVFAGAAEYLGFSIDRSPTAEDIGVEWDKRQEGNLAIRGSNFFFSPEDEEEVRDLTRKLHDFQPQAAVKKQEDDKAIADKVDKISENIRINFSSQDLHKRLKQVLATYVKGVRSRIDTKQTLLRGVDEGGLALNDMLANKVLSAADKVMAESALPVEPAPAQPVSIAPADPAAAGDVPYDFAALAAAAPAPASREAAPLAPDTQAIAPVPPAPAHFEDRARPKKKEIDLDNLDFSVKDVPVEKAQPMDQIQPPEPAEAAVSADDAVLAPALTPPPALDLRADTPPPAPRAQTAEDFGNEPVLNLKITPDEEAQPRKPQPVPLRPNASISGKVRMDDVKYVPKLTGPVDELKDLTLEDFRRLGDNGPARTRKIMEKVSFLEQDNYQQRLTGIKAWRQSPVNRLYLAIGQESITHNSGISTVISRRRDAGQAALTPDEFNAIMELNKELRF